MVQLSLRLLGKAYAAFVIVGAIVGATVLFTSRDNRAGGELPAARVAVRGREHVEHGRRLQVVNTNACTFDDDCGAHGSCVMRSHNSTESEKYTVCVCDVGWIQESGKCTYEQKHKWSAYHMSSFFGLFGADWFYLARGDPGYIVAGVFKLLTTGGFLIWYLVDVGRILTDDFSDGNGQPLSTQSL